MTGLPTGLKQLDAVLGGFQRSDLIVIAGGQDAGKTTLALNIVEHVGCRERHATLIFSPGMSKEQLALRMLSAHCDVAFRTLLGGHLCDDDLEGIVERGMGVLREAPIFIVDTPMIGGTELRGQARRLKSRCDIEFIVVAHPHLVSEPPGEDRHRTGAAIHNLKALARELAVPILVLLQTAPQAGDVVAAETRIDDLPAAGVAEQDVDVAMVLTRSRDEAGRYTDDAMLTVVKQRNGPLGNIELAFSQDHMRFRPASAR